VSLPQRRFIVLTGAALLLAPLLTVGTSSPAQGAARAKHPVPRFTRDTVHKSAEGEGRSFQVFRDEYLQSRRIAGDQPLTTQQASEARDEAADAAAAPSQGPGNPGPAVGAPWSPVGPMPTLQVGRTSGNLEEVAGRISSLALDSSGRAYLGTAQGGVWARNPADPGWTPLTDSLPTLAVGAVAVAPSNQSLVYLGTGEGDLSGDSYAGDGFWRSPDKGKTWQHVSGTAFRGVSVAKLAVDAKNANHVYAAVLSGVGGARRITPEPSASYGIYETTDGGVTWLLRKGTTDRHFAPVDVVVDPQQGNVVYASFLGDGIYKSFDHGLHWGRVTKGLPANMDWAAGNTRAALAISHPNPKVASFLYTGFEYNTKDGVHHSSRIWRSSDSANTWNELPTGPAGSIDSILGYCDGQCSYDNVLVADPVNPDVIYVGGLYQYGLASGGVYRTTDAGKHWLSLGFDLHPDFHALAIQPGKPRTVFLGNDGGVWSSQNRGGRTTPGATLDQVDWKNLNQGLQATQFTSIATVPHQPGVLWGGTQDNGTQVTFGDGDPTFYDIGMGDGGQVLVDPTDDRFVYGTHYDIDPYRIDAQNLAFGGYQPIARGISLGDRSEFYVPWVMNKGNTDQLLLGTYRVYRTDNAKTEKASDVTWKPISPDLTSGCAGRAPNGGSGCVISALGIADGGAGAYAGTVDGYVSVSPNAATSDSPSWKRVGTSTIPLRPVTQIAVDRSNWRIAYVSLAGFGSATPGKPGHLFATKDGGASWKDVSSQLPDAPVNSVVLDPADAKTLYAGTDVGPFVTHDGGATWNKLGTVIPGVAVFQLDEDSTNGVLAAGTYGRGAWTQDTGVTKPALVLQPSDTGKPVGPGSTLTFQLALHNIGNADATGVGVTVPNPAHTDFVSASDGGKNRPAAVTWTGLSVPKGGTKVLTLTVKVRNLPASVTSLVLDGAKVTSAQGSVTSGSPYTKAISPAHAVTLLPAAQTDGGRSGTSVDYPVTVRNQGYLADTFTVTATGGWTATVLDATCTSPAASTGGLAAGASATRCVRVSIPAAAADGATSPTTVTATGSGTSATATLTTIAVTKDTLFVDGDGDAPDTGDYYKAALTANGVSFATWDLAESSNLPGGYLAAHKTVVWGTGNSYPAPITRYETVLTRFLNGGGRLLMSGQDVLDQAAGTTDFVRDYLHVNWDGSENQNDKPTDFVVGQPTDPVAGTQGQVAIDHDVLGATYEDELTLIAPASAAFKDDKGAVDGLSVAAGPYKVVFLAFPFEAYGTAASRTSLMKGALTWFGA
jgi:uncharacterized repeat protein (TIGR01451 family)